MKKQLIILFCFCAFAKEAICQDWSGGGNPAAPPGLAITSANNFLGTTSTNNTPIRFGTFGNQRIYVDNTASGVLGNVGIGSSFNPFFRPFSLLHIAQDNNINTAGSIRNWMAPGAPSTYANTTGTGMLISNGDNIWLGLRHKGVWDANDAVLAWGDNGGDGTDYFRFVLNHWNVGGAPGGTNDGMEIMRFDPTSSYVGIGDFMISNIQTPQSKVHIHEDFSLQPGGGNGQSVWMQMTNHDFAPTPTANDGLRIGVLFQNAGLRTGNAFIYNQENRHLIFSTNHATPDGPGSINNTQERMRLTSAGAPTTLVGGYGVFNPNGVAPQNSDFTRVAISLNPNNPIQRPLSLLHLGYQASGAGANLDGWRNWMENGTFTNSDIGFSMYSGLKGNSPDAILSWGYTPTPAAFFGSRMRILFTTPTTGTLTAASANGIEAAHFWSDGNNTRMGVGDMQTTNVDPQNTLEIRSSTASPYFTTPGGYGSSGLRFTFLNSGHNPVPNGANGVDNTKLLTVDKNGDVVLTNVSAGVSNADNGLSIDGPTTNLIHLGQTYTGAPAYSGAGELLDDREIPLNGFDLVFSGIANPGKNRVSIGNAPFPGSDQTTYIDAAAKLSVQNFTEQGGAHFQTLPLLFASVPNMYYGAKGTVLAQHPDKKIYGLYGQALTTGATFKGIGVFGEATGSGINIGVYGRNFGGTPNSYGGYFEGNVSVQNTLFANGGTFTTSDQRIKDDVRVIESPLAIIGKLKPVSFKYNNTYAPQLNSDESKSYGFIAQQVGEILPELVKDVYIFSTTDSLGNPIGNDDTLKSLNYEGIIPFAIGGIQELDKKQREILKSLEKIGLSDAQVKNNVSSFNALTKIKQLSPVSYNFTNANVPQLSFGNTTDYGFVAQQLETVYPELIDTVRIAETLDSLGNIQNPSVVLKTVNYKAMTALLTRAVQEQQLTIDSLKQAHNSQDSINNLVQNQLAQLTVLMNSCCQNTSSRTNTTANNTVIDVELSDKDIIVLNQNVPNPFAEQTTIAYSIPEKSGFAQIIFNDMKGQIIKVVDIKTKGKGQLNVFANDLSTGMYTYSLYVDGKLIDTKKMVKTE